MGWEVGREVQEGRDMYIPIVDLWLCMAEMNTSLLIINYNCKVVILQLKIN